MIKSIQKVIRIGSSGGVTIPAKDLKRQNIAFGDEVEVIVRPLYSTNIEDQKVLDAAKKSLGLTGKILKISQSDDRFVLRAVTGASCVSS